MYDLQKKLITLRIELLVSSVASAMLPLSYPTHIFNHYISALQNLPIFEFISSLFVTTLIHSRVHQHIISDPAIFFMIYTHNTIGLKRLVQVELVYS